MQELDRAVFKGGWGGGGPLCHPRPPFNLASRDTRSGLPPPPPLFSIPQFHPPLAKFLYTALAGSAESEAVCG